MKLVTSANELKQSAITWHYAHIMVMGAIHYKPCKNVWTTEQASKTQKTKKQDYILEMYPGTARPSTEETQTIL